MFDLFNTPDSLNIWYIVNGDTRCDTSLNKKNDALVKLLQRLYSHGNEIVICKLIPNCSLIKDKYNFMYIFADSKYYCEMKLKSPFDGSTDILIPKLIEMGGFEMVVSIDINKNLIDHMKTIPLNAESFSSSILTSFEMRVRGIIKREE